MLPRFFGYINRQEVLNLSDKKLGDRQAKQIGEELASNTTLTRLDVSDNRIGGDGAVAIAIALRTNQSLEELNLGYNETGGVGMTAIAQALTLNNSLKELRLGGNKIGIVEMGCLADGLKVNTGLTELCLSYCSIDAVRAVTLFDALKSNTTLERLTLQGNNELGTVGIKSLADALKVNTGLAELGLNLCSIDDEGAEMLAEALKSNSTLATLCLFGNIFGDLGAQAILNVLTEYNTTLTCLDLHHGTGRITATALAAIKNMIAANKAGTRSGVHPIVSIAPSPPIQSDSTIAPLQYRLPPVPEPQPPPTVASKAEPTPTAPIQANLARQVDELVRYIHDETKLDVSYKKIGAEQAKQLAKELATNTTLKSLALHANCIGDDGAAAIAIALQASTSLEALNLGYNGICDVGMTAIAQTLTLNNSLKELRLGGNMIGTSGLRSLAFALKVNTGLTTLSIFNCSIDDKGAAILADVLKSNTTLATLYLFINKIGDVGAQAILDILVEYNTTLTNLDLDGNANISPTLFSAIKRMVAANKAGTRSFVAPIIDGAPSAPIQSHSTIKSLQHHPPPEEEIGAKRRAAEPPAAIGETVAADRDGTRAAETCLVSASSRQAGSVHEKTEPDLTEQGTGAGHVKQIPVASVPLHQVRYIDGQAKLYLDSKRIGPEQAKQIARELSTNTSLKLLSLSCNIIGNDGAVSIANALRTNKSLERLFLCRNEIGDVGVTSLANSFTQNVSLMELNLGGNKIGTVGARSLAEALKVNTGFSVLSLKSCSIDDDGAAILGDALTTNAKLAKLDLSGNRIGTVGVVAIAAALEVNNSLTWLWLNSCSIDNKGATSLASALKVNSVVTKLWLRSCSINDGTATAMLNVLNEYNTTLKYLDLDGNRDISSTVRSAIESMVAANRDGTRPVARVSGAPGRPIQSDSSIAALQHLSPRQTQSELPMPKVAPTENQNTATASIQQHPASGTKPEPLPEVTNENSTKAPTNPASVVPSGTKCQRGWWMSLSMPRVEMDFEIVRLTTVRDACLDTPDGRQWKQGNAADKRIRQLKKAIANGKHPTRQELEVMIDELNKAIREKVQNKSVAAAMPLRRRLEQLQASLARECEAEGRVQAETDSIGVGRRAVVAALHSTDPSDEIGSVPIDYLALITSNWTEEIGNGGSGVVFRGQDATSGVVIAIKKIRLHESERKQFKNELEVRVFLNV
jgi:Ran GTPase-activating protein (RanGAP) involved in mRNA processing and transport